MLLIPSRKRFVTPPIPHHTSLVRYGIARMCAIFLLTYLGFATMSCDQLDPHISVQDIHTAPDTTYCDCANKIYNASPTNAGITGTNSLNLSVNTDMEISEEESFACGFIPVEKEPYIDIKELQKRVIYPDLAKRARIEGKVNVRVLVGKNGIPRKHIIESSDSDLLNDAAVRVVMNSVFTPAIQNNQPIELWISLPVIFRLP